MKKTLLLLGFLYIGCFVSAQEKQFSLSVQAGSMFYLAKNSSNIQVRQNGNYDAGFLLTYKANPDFEVKTGIMFFSKRFSQYYSWATPNPLYESEDHYALYYLRIPLYYSINFCHHPKYHLYSSFGASFGHLYMGFRSATYNNGNTYWGFDSLVYYYRNPVFLNISAGISYRLNDRFSLRAEPWYSYMLLEDFIAVPGAFRVSLSHQQAGLSFGLDWDFGIPCLQTKKEQRL